MTPSKFKVFQEFIAHEMNKLHQIILRRWPDHKQEAPHCVREFWNVREELSVADGVILKGMRLAVPPTMRQDLLNQIYVSHLRIAKCKQRAREALFCPGMSQEVHQIVRNCPTCDTYQNRQPSETLRPTKSPELPWTEITSDLFERKRPHYIVTVDYASKYIEVEPLQDLSATSAIEALIPSSPDTESLN